MFKTLDPKAAVSNLGHLEPPLTKKKTGGKDSTSGTGAGGGTKLPPIVKKPTSSGKDGAA